MPFKSFAQLRKFGSLVKQKKMSEATFKHWLRETDTAHLQERVTKKDDRQRKAKKT